MPMAMTLLALPRAPVWVIDAPACGEALALAGRLDLPYLRLPPGQARGRAALRFRDQAHGPSLVISAGARAGAEAIGLRARFGAQLVHVSRHAHTVLPFDVMVRPAMHERAPAPRVLPAIGPLHVVSPTLIAEARALWRERLAHLPRPRIALVVRGGRALAPDRLARLGTRLASLAASRRGAVLASVGDGSGREAVAALAASLGPCLHVLYRTDEPGQDPTLGFIGNADAIVVAGAAARTLSEAAAADLPVFTDPCGDGDTDGRRLVRTLAEQGRVRPFSDDISPWPRRPLDETGRVALEIRRILGL